MCPNNIVQKGCKFERHASPLKTQENLWEWSSRYMYVWQKVCHLQIYITEIWRITKYRFWQQNYPPCFYQSRAFVTGQHGNWPNLSYRIIVVWQVVPHAAHLAGCDVHHGGSWSELWWNSPPPSPTLPASRADSTTSGPTQVGLYLCLLSYCLFEGRMFNFISLSCVWDHTSCLRLTGDGIFYIHWLWLGHQMALSFLSFVTLPYTTAWWPVCQAGYLIYWILHENIYRQWRGLGVAKHATAFSQRKKKVKNICNHSLTRVSKPI